MRLIRLTANDPGFRTVDFNPIGVTLIVGAQKEPKNRDRSRTYNGVGKSLIVVLIRFCLGYSKIEEFAVKLPGWEFTLEFEQNDEVFSVSRSTSDQRLLKVNGEDLKPDDFCRKLEQSVFSLDEPVPYLKFRPLLSRFVRPNKAAYVSFDGAEPDEKPYERLLRTGYLLGLDASIIREKYELRKEQDRVKVLNDNLKKDPIFLEFFGGKKDADIELYDLSEEIKSLQDSLLSFRVAEDYHQKEREADAAQARLQKLRNEWFAITNAVSQIIESSKVKSDLSPSHVIGLYEQAKIHLGDNVKKHVEEVANFHARLIENRVQRLNADRQSYEKRLRDLQQLIGEANVELDSLMGYLGSHGAMDEFVRLTNTLHTKESTADKLKTYKALIAQYSNESQRLKAEISSSSIRANQYLVDTASVISKNFEVFRRLSKQFYGERAGGLTVSNNEGENQTRFDIKAKIQDDASDGINEVKLFCFDMTLLHLKHNHDVEFVFHDSRLFSDIDPRQRATIFRVASEVAHSAQYIATINEDQIESMRPEFSESEFEELILSKVSLRLTDDSPASKLLGCQVDLDF